jgi:hypothetical protein
MGLNDETDLAAELQSLQERGETLQRRNLSTRREILDLLEIPEDGAVTVRYDASGLMSVVEIDDGARAGLTPTQLVREINAAIIRSSGLLSLATPEVSDPQGASTVRLVSEVAAGMADDRQLEPQRISNDFGTVTVTAMLGNVAGVECAESWIASTSSRLISEEIVRMARIAAKDTDTVGKYA